MQNAVVVSWIQCSSLLLYKTVQKDSFSSFYSSSASPFLPEFIALRGATGVRHVPPYRTMCVCAEGWNRRHGGICPSDVFFMLRLSPNHSLSPSREEMGVFWLSPDLSVVGGDALKRRERRTMHRRGNQPVEETGRETGSNPFFPLLAPTELKNEKTQTTSLFFILLFF